MIAAEELDMEMSQMNARVSRHGVTPDTAAKAASTRSRTRARGVRAAAASAKQTLLGLASTQLGVPVSQPLGEQGSGHRAAARPSPTALLGEKLFNVRMPDSYNMTARGNGVFAFPADSSPAYAGEAGQSVQDRRHACRRTSTSRRSSSAT